MDGESGNKGPAGEGPTIEAARPPERVDDARRTGARPGPTWRAWILSIVAAIVLSVAATLLLGGSFRLPGASNGAAGERGDRSAGPCCPVQGEGRR